MKALRAALYSLIIVTFTTTALQAAIYPLTLQTYDSGCVSDFSTAGCFRYNNPTNIASNDPTVTACIAKRTNGQQCRTCAAVFTDDGTYVGYAVCGEVDDDAACKCNNARTSKCSNQGSCDYRLF
jgi:hypothetical protein